MWAPTEYLSSFVVSAWPNKLAYIWDNSGQMPDPRFEDAQDSDFSWIASSTAGAQRAGVAPPAGLTVIAPRAGQGGQKRGP